MDRNDRQSRPDPLAEALALCRAGKLDEAARCCQRRLADSPDFPPALHVLGRIETQRNRCENAAGLLMRAASLSPRDPTLLSDLSACMGRLGRAAESERYARAAVALRDDLPEAWNNLGAALKGQGRLRQAGAACARALRLRVGYPEAHYNLAEVLRAVGRTREALREYEFAIALRPAYGAALNGMAVALADLGQADQVIRANRRWVQACPALAEARSALLYSMHYSPACGPLEIAREHRDWGGLFCQPLAGQIGPHANDRSPGRRLRIGYLSPDLREHTVTKFATAGIQYHDPEQTEVFCYSDAENPDHVTERLRGMAEQWRDTRKLNDSRLEELIRHDRIDLLVDLRGHAASNRLTLFARKPAPVQINMVGYFDTTGLSSMDYRLTDAHMDPPGQTEHLNSERLVRIEPSCWCYTPEPNAPEVAEPPALKNGFLTFGSLNKIVKVSEPCAKLWGRVLESAPGSRLLLSAAGDAGPVVRRRLGAMGLPADRIEILDKVRSSREYLERFARIDLALDTWPFNGITTTCDGLWMGVPCVSVTGETSASRAGKSILHAANLPELAAETFDGFVEAASAVAHDLDRLRALRSSMRRRLLASPLMDHRSFVRNLEAAYRAMWRAWCDGPAR